MRGSARLWLQGLSGAAILAAFAVWVYLAVGSPGFSAPAAPPPPPPQASAAATPADPPAHDRNELALGAAQLAKELERRPQDADGWRLLARTYTALGQDEAAVAALRKGAHAVPGNLDLLLAFADALLAHIDSEPLPQEFVEVMSRINALDPDQADSLWYLGTAAAGAGDSARARALWGRLLTLLPADHPARAELQARLERLR
jgi:cytochrome c-type biogenesis protein CcmH